VAFPALDPAPLEPPVDEAEAALLLRDVDSLARQLWAEARPALELPPPPPPRRRLSERLRPPSRSLQLAITAGVVALATVRLSGGPFATVNGQRVRLVDAHPTIAGVLGDAGLRPHDGVLRAAGSHRILDARAQPALAFLDGVASRMSTPVRSGERIRLVNGVDRVEPVDRRRIPIVATGLPPVERRLWHLGRGGVDEVMVGRYSGEILHRRVLQRAAAATPETSKVVALTFDDGPDPRWTPAVLDVLQRNNIKATFCLIGLWVDRYPDLVRAELKQGHKLCDHTVHHPLHLEHAPHDQVVAEVDDNADAIRRVTGQDPAFFRAPGGNLNNDVIDVAHERGLRVLGWAVDPHDYEKITPPLLLGRVMAEVKPGAIVLMHDGGGDRSATVAALQAVIDNLRAQGYTFATP